MKMNKKLTIQTLWILTLFLLVAPSSVFATQYEEEEEWNRSFDIGPNGSFALTNISGDIVIRGGASDQVRVQAVKEVHRASSDAEARRQLDRVDIQVTHTGNRLRIKTHYAEKDRDHDSSVSVDFEVIVPSGTEVSAKSVSGDIEVSNIQGELKAETVSGEVDVQSADKLVLAKSVSGSVEVAAAKGAENMEISSVSGDVEVDGLDAPRVTFESVSGDIEITDAKCARASLKTVSGDVRYVGPLESSGRYEFQSHSGDVNVVISGDTGFEIDAKSFSGEIESEFPLEVHSIRGERRKLSGVYGDGSAYIEATTFSGDVSIEKR
jgi:DUF4097 and DUF4098 domain-containing protein YvlB